MPMSAADMLLDPEAIQDLGLLVQHADQLDGIVAATADLPPNALESKAAVDDFASRAGLPPAEGRRVIRILYGLTSIQTESGLAPVEMGRAAEEAVGRAPTELNQQNLPDRTTAGAVVRRAVERIGLEHPIRVARQIERALNAQQNTLVEMRLRPELRPIFDDCDEKIRHAVIVYRLVLHFLDGGRRNKIEFGLDAKDVADLRLLCQKAESQAAQLREALNDKPWHTSVATPGDD